MTQTQADPSKTVFSPQQVSTGAVASIEQAQKERGSGVRFGLRAVDEILNPMRPGHLRIVLGFPSNGKSSVANFISRKEAARIVEAGEQNKVVITATWEQSIEDQGILDIAQAVPISMTKLERGEISDQEWRELRGAAVRRGGLPWWIIGHSDQASERRPRLTIDQVYQAVEYMIDVQGIQPALICLDYLQRIRRSGGDDTRLQYGEIVEKSKDMALVFHCPVMLLSQVNREVKKRAWKLPQLEDASETSNIEQAADSAISCWMPKQDYPIGQQIQYGADTFEVSENLMVMGVLKQKKGKAPHLFGLEARPEINEFRALDTRTTKLNEGWKP